MVDKKLIDYIKKELDSGFSIKRIKEALSKKGYDSDVVNDAINIIKPELPSQKKQIVIKPIIIGGLLLLIVIIGIIFFSIKTIKVDEKMPALNDDLSVEVDEKMQVLNDDLPIDIQKELIDKFLDECVKEDEEYWKCTALIKEDVTDCYYDLLAERQITECTDDYHFYTAIKKSKSDICSNIDRPELKSRCLKITGSDKCDEDLLCNAITNNDVDNCKGDIDCIEDFYIIDAFKTQNMAACDNIDTKGLIKTFCKAITEKNPDSCKKIVNEDCGNRINFRLAETNNDFSYCDEIVEEEVKESCEVNLNSKILSLALSEQTLSTCSELKGEAQKSCISIINSDVDKCKSIKNEKYKFYCLINAAEFTNNLDLCNELTDTTLKENCENYLRNM